MKDCPRRQVPTTQPGEKNVKVGREWVHVWNVEETIG